MRRNISNLISVILFGRLAVESRYQLCCFGYDLVRPALERTWQVAEIDGSRGILTEPNDDDSRTFLHVLRLPRLFPNAKGSSMMLYRR